MGQQNVILITADSVRSDFCGFQNDDVKTTPFLSRNRDDALIFENAIAPGPRTLSSVPVSMTGTHMPMNEDDMSVYENRVARIRGHVNEYEPIARRFQERGYETLGFTTNPWTSRRNDFDRGFDTYEEFEDDEEGLLRRALSDTPLDTPSRFFDQWLNNKVWFSQWPTYYDTIANELTETAEPFFLWVFLLDTHNPYFPVNEDRVESSTLGMYVNMLRGNSLFGQSDSSSAHKADLDPAVLSSIQRAYRDTIRSVDRFVETIWNDFADLDPLLLFHSDHGEAFGEHGNYGHQPTLFEENIHVPLYLLNAGRSGTIDQPVGLKAVPQMLIDAVEGEVTVPETERDQYVFSKTEDNNSIAIRGERWKFISRPSGNRLYDLSSDAAERTSVLESNPQTADKLHSLLTDFVETLPRGDVSASDADENDRSVRDRLDSLGYLS